MVGPYKVTISAAIAWYICPVKKIAVFASGAGSNAQKIIDHFRNHDTIHVFLLVSNRPDAAVLKIADRENIPTLLIEKEKFYHGNGYVEELRKENIDLIVLAGFLWKIPSALIKAYPEKIINVHPALLPKYGGKGMYGKHVHQAVLNNQEKESGITIHFVDEIYDHGQIIFQTTCPVFPDDDTITLAHRIQALEHKYYPVIIEDLMKKIGLI